MRSGKILLLGFAVLCLMGEWTAPPEACAQQRTLGPVLRIYTDPFLFDTVRCRIRRCVPLTFHNIGDTALVVHNHDVVRRPFYTRIDTPLVLQPGEMRTFDLCYNPAQYSTDSQRVFFRADTRLPLSIAMVHDVSSSMFTDMPGGRKRYQAAHDASVEFIGNLLDTLGIVDEAAVFTYDDNEHFKVVQPWTTDTAALRAAIPNVVLGTATCTYDAISRVVDSMDTRVKKRILIMVTDGEDSGVPTCGIASPESVIKKAKDHDVRIYAITIGSIDRAPLIQIAKATGGREFNATLSTDLLAIYREIAVDMSKNVEVSIFTKGAATGPKLEITPPAWSFDSVQVGETACEDVLVRNAGNAWLHADSVRKVFQPPYSLQDLMVDSIAPFQTVPARVCFTPLLPLHYNVPMPYFPSPCEFAEDTLTGTGSSYLLPREPRKRPLLEVRMPAFDTTFCRTTECTTLELRNTGDTTVTVRSLDFIPPPFTGSATVPFDIAAGEMKSITICYTPPDAPRLDTLRLGFTADMRTPQRVALFFDEGEAMGEEFMPGLSRLLAATAGASDFTDGFVFTSAFSDAVTIARFDSADALYWDGRYFTDRDSLRAALPDSAGRRVSCPFDPIDRLLTGFDGLHVLPGAIVLFTAGQTAGAACGPVTATDLASHAQALGTRIHCVQLSDADSTELRQLAQATGGRYLRPQSLLDLILQLRDLEEEFSRDVRYTGSAVARGVTPIVQVDRDTIDCGVYYSDNGTSPKLGRMLVTNSGDAPLVLILGEGLGPKFISVGRTELGWPPMIPGDSVIILPGKTVRWEIQFSGKEDRAYFDTLVLLHNSCVQPTLEIPVVGRCIVVPAYAWDFPAGVDIDSLIHFGIITCGGERCSDLMLRNPGPDSTEIRMPIPPAPPFSLTQPGPFAIPALDSLRLPICYQPSAAGHHSQIVEFEMEDTPPRSIVFVLASDASTNDTLPEGIRFWVQNRAVLQTYVRYMHGDTLDQDETAFIGFDAAGIDTLLAFSRDRGLVSHPFTDSTTAGTGDLAFALNAAMDYASANAQGEKLVIAIVNDANAMNPADASALRFRADQEQVTLAIASVGQSGFAALAPTGSTVGRFDSCFTRESLERFLYETTGSRTRTVRDSVLLTGTATEARLEIDPMTLDFGRMRVGGDACLPVTLRNTGDATVRMIDVINPVEPFPATFPDTLAAGESAVVELCITVSALGLQRAEALFVYQVCALDTLRVAVSVTGYDSVNVGIDGVYRGMPGHVIRIPVRLYGSVPSSYGARGYDLNLTYDKTMLYPLTEEIVTEGTATHGMRLSRPWPTLTRLFDEASSEATAIYRVVGADAMHSPQASAVLLSPPFLVLHGSAMETPVRVTEFSFLGGRPAAGIAGSGTFVADSLCFQEQRLIDASRRFNLQLVGGYPNPFNPTATIVFSLREPAHLRATIHDALGREVARLAEGPFDAGLHRVVFDASGLPTGLYFYHLESGGERQSGSLLSLK